MKRILVIGAKGMLGRDVMERFCSSSLYDVTGWDIDEIDVRIEKDTVEKISCLRPEVVLNLAALTHVDECESQEGKAFAVNAEGMRHIALGASKCGARAVYISTDYVFDGQKGRAYVEDDPPHPLNVYGRSKLQGEHYVQELTKDGLIVRTQWLFGKHGNNFVATVLRLAREKKELSIVNDLRGSPTYTVDLANVLSALIQCEAKGVFHAANSETCTWFEYGQSILEFSGITGVTVRPISEKESNRPAVRPPYSELNCQKLKQVTGMTLRPWSEALKEYLNSLNPGGGYRP